MKKELSINLDSYFKWYSEWLNKNIDDIKNGDYPFTMFDDWIDMQSLELTNDLIGKEVYFSINGDHKDTIMTDVWLEGVVVRKGIVEEIYDEKVKINGIVYIFDRLDSTGFFFLDKDLLLASLHYDGCEIYDGITLKECFNGNFVNDETL